MMLLVRENEPDENDIDDDDYDGNWVEDLAMGRNNRNSDYDQLSWEEQSRLLQTRRQMLGIFLLLGIFWCLFIGGSNSGYERDGASSMFRLGGNSNNNQADANSKSHGPLPNGMSPSTQQWFKAAKTKKQHTTEENDSNAIAEDNAPASCMTSTRIHKIVVMDPKSVLKGIEQNLFDMIIDVRTSSEWRETGHYPNATLMENLADSSLEDITSKMKLSCMTNINSTIVVYCHSGKRASKAIEKLIQAGFCGSTLINGQGVKQWIAAGLELSHTNSYVPKCWEEEKEVEEKNEDNQDHM